MARTYEGIKGSKIDLISISLRWDTAQGLGACSNALTYWKRVYRKRALLLTSDLIKEFTANVVGVDVVGWVDELTYEHVFVPRSSPLRLVRFIKVALLRKFSPKTHEGLGGRTSR